MTRTKVRLTKYASIKNGKTYEYWLLRWCDGRGNRHGKNIGRSGGRDGRSRRQAELERSRFEDEVNAYRNLRENVKAPTLGEYLDRYLAVRQTELSPGTLELHERTGKYLKEYFGNNRRLDDIAKADARDFKAALGDNKLSTKVKPSFCTVNQHIRNARKMFAVAVDDELLLGNPFGKLTSQDPSPRAWHEVTEDEFRKLMEIARFDWRLLLTLACWAGLRRGEALNLRWENIDWERHRLTVIANEEWKPKDKDSRTIPIAPDLHRLILAASKGIADQRGKVIPGTINERNVDRDFKVLCRRAGVVPWRKPMHTLRKTCLTRWARQFPLHVVKEWAGHGDERTTLKFYLKVSESEYDKAAGLGQDVSAVSSQRPAAGGCIHPASATMKNVHGFRSIAEL
jgi:integrase